MKEVIVITGTNAEFEKWCMDNGRDRKTAAQIRHPDQLKHYSEDVEIIFYGDYALNPVYGSKELNERLDKQILNEIKQGRI